MMTNSNGSTAVLQLEQKERIRKAGYKSVNDFIKLAVMEKLEHDEKNFKIRHKNIITYKAQNVIIILSKGNKAKARKEKNEAKI